MDMSFQGLAVFQCPMPWLRHSRDVYRFISAYEYCNIRDLRHADIGFLMVIEFIFVFLSIYVKVH